MNPLSNIDDMEKKSILYRWILYQTWWSSMAMFNYQRVTSGFSDFLGFLTFRQTHVVIFSVMAVKHNVLITQVMFKHVSSDSFWYLSILLPQYCKSYEQRIPQKLMESIIIFPPHIQLYIVGDVYMQNTFPIWPMPLHSQVFWSFCDPLYDTWIIFVEYVSHQITIQ